MKIGEAKIGMRVNLCWTICRKNGWSRGVYDYWRQFFPSQIIEIVNSGYIKVESLSEYIFHPNDLVF